MQEGRILLRSGIDPRVDEVPLNNKLRNFYKALGLVWDSEKPRFDANQLKYVSVVDNALGFPDLPLKEGFKLQIPWDVKQQSVVYADNPWRLHFEVDPNSPIIISLRASVLAVHQRHKSDSFTPRTKKLAEIEVQFNPVELRQGDRQRIEEYERALRCGWKSVLPESAIEGKYRPFKWSLDLKYLPRHLGYQTPGRKSPLVDRPVYEGSRVGVAYYFNGLPVDFGRTDQEINLESYEFRNPGEFRKKCHYFPGVKVPGTA